MFKKLLVLLALGLLTLPAFAKYVTPLGGPGVEITMFFTHQTGAVTLYVSGEKLNLDNCAATYRVHIPHDIAGRDTMVANAMMAFASGKKIGLHASGCKTTPFWGGTVEVPIINNLWVFK